MKSGFDANVPKRKPRTRLAAMLAEVDGAEDAPETPSPQNGADAELDAALTHALDEGLVLAPPPPVAVATPVVSPTPVARPAASEPRAEPGARALPERAPVASRPLPEVEAGGALAKTGRARIAELKARLEAANRRREEKPPEPEATASRVRETVAALRDQLDQGRLERTELIKALDVARNELGETQELLESERKARVHAELLAGERQSVADELLSESEALAVERDRALACIADLKELDAQQVALLQQMEAQLEERDRALDRARAQVTDLRGGLDAAQADADAMQARLHMVLNERADLEARAAKLEAELARAHSARQALGEIQKLVDAIN